MLNFLYTSDYEIEAEDSHGTNSPLNLHARLYTIADKYGIDSLLALVAEKYRDLLRQNPGVEDYLASISQVYTPPATSNALQKLAVAFGRKVLKNAIKQEHLRGRLRLLISDVPEFGYDIAEAFITAPLRGTCRDCGPGQVAESLQARCEKCRRGGVFLLY